MKHIAHLQITVGFIVVAALLAIFSASWVRAGNGKPHPKQEQHRSTQR